MTRIRFPAALLALALLPSSAFAAGNLELLPAMEGDQIPGKLGAAKRAPPASLERAPVAFAWALDPAAALSASAPHVGESREHWKQIDAAQLAQGVALHTTARGAVLRLSPLAHGAKRALDAQRLELRHAGRTLRGEAAFEQFADAAQLKAAGLDVPEHTIAFRLRPGLGAGEFTLALPGADGGVLLHMFEPDSGEVLKLSADRGTVLQDETLELSVEFDSTQGRHLSEVVGTIAAPNGRLFDLRFDAAGEGRWNARAPIDAAAGAGEGLWEVHATGYGNDGTLQRDVRTAFQAVVPGAKLAGGAEVTRAKNGALRLALPLQVAQPSRYNVAGVLYGSDAEAKLRPFAIAHAAAWAEPGAATLVLEFDPKLLAGTGLQPPYELRDLELSDQATLGRIERRQRALRFD